MAWARRHSAALTFCAAVAACNGAKFSSTQDGGAGSSNEAGEGGDPEPGGGQPGQNGGSSSAGKGSSTSGSSSRGASGSSGDPNPSLGGEGGTAVDPGPEIPTEGLVYWFRADKGANLDESVAKWLDQSGNGFDATQIQLDLQPKLLETNLLDVPLVAFDGEDDFLELPEQKVDMTQGLSFFAVVGQDHVHECVPFIELSNGSELNDVNFGALGETFQYEIDQQSLPGEAGAFPPMAMRLFEVHHAHDNDQDVAEMRVNGTLIGSKVMYLPPNLLRVSNFIGKSLYLSCSLFAGGMAELILYRRKVAPDERAAIDLYLAGKWQ